MDDHRICQGEFSKRSRLGLYKKQIEHTDLMMSPSPLQRGEADILSVDKMTNETMQGPVFGILIWRLRADYIIDPN